MKKTFVLFSALILLSSCIKTAEQVQREKRIESMSEQMNDSQGLMADLINQVKRLQTQNDRLTGRLEELEHKQGQSNSEHNKKIAENLSLMKSQQEAQNTRLDQVQNELKEQRAFLEKVTNGLKDIGQPKSTHHNGNGKAKKKNTKEELAEALALVQDNQFPKARTELEALIDHEELTPGDQNKIVHALGRVEYYTKNYDKALIYFSKIYSKYPKSSLAPSSLLYIAKSLKRMGKKDESNEALLKLTEDYPSTKEATLAKKKI